MSSFTKCLLPILLLVGCFRWDAAQPFDLIIDDDSIPKQQAVAAFAVGIQGIGGTVVPGARQVFHVAVDKKCTGNTIGHDDALTANVLRLCLDVLVRPKQFRKVFLHELGHGLGARHTLCDPDWRKNGIMAPDQNCSDPNLDHFVPSDIAEICAEGGLSSEKCTAPVLGGAP